ncbi:probable disease resistance protein At1g61300 [Durio zibethinus]|uniref:Probable disease resistance protein At1g61300 n=1 Tax=Durio zibethinus TaxID=66656 RepID=A0A6P5Y4B9_DURZI|nr:probable disease resistance protein At1g61300 [Durio zibethinus]XP_022735265.1 probable disease resistance protein At1g61300 [Durio zibethinus]
MELLEPIFEMIKCIGVPTCRYLNNHLKLEENVNELRRRLDDLNVRKQDIESRQEAEVRCRKVVRKEVEKWLDDVERMNTEYQKIEQKIHFVSYFCRGRLGKIVCKKIKEVKEIYQQGNFPEGVAIDKPPANGVTFQTTSLEGETYVKEQIWRYLMGNEVGMIAVCGMGGIGKTTIMKHINNQLLKETDGFDKVIWVTVSKEPNVVKLQEDIARALSQCLPQNELERATELMDILKAKRYVLILDDVWKRFSLLDVGIPEPTLHNGSKLVITSRLIDVCLSMGCQVIKMQPLSEEESLNLFLNQVGRSVVEIPTLKEIVEHIVQHCGGLPLAIVTIAGSMKGVDDVREWRNALNQLCGRLNSVRGLETEIFECLMFSYERLGDPKIQNCFLYCALYPEDHAIKRRELIEKWIDEKLIDECESRQIMYDWGHSILNKLEKHCLLEKCQTRSLFPEEGVKMHDVLRDMALSIKSISPRFMVKAGMQLKELPGENEWTDDLEKISLMHNSISEIPDGISPECYFLSTLLLQENGEVKRISESFFEHMPRLKVLDLSYTGISELPNCISNLGNLVSLVLRGCDKLRQVPSLAKLRALRKLDLFNTAIKEVPHGIEMLVNLTYLGLYSESLKELPKGLLLKLSHLQYLSTTLCVKGEEVAKLRNLETFAGLFLDFQGFQNYAKSIPDRQWPINYVLGVGSDWPLEVTFNSVKYFEKPEFYNEINCINCEIGKEDQVSLPNNLHSLNIKKCHDLTSLSNISLFHQANELKRCYISACEGMECVLDMSLSSYNSLHNIELLFLKELCNLLELVRVGVAVSSASRPRTRPAIFSSLKVFILVKCLKMKKLFTLELLQGLQNLEEIEVRDCKEIEEIIAAEGNGANIPTTVVLPKLRELWLICLPELKSFCRIEVMIQADSIQYLWISGCPKLKRMIPLFLPFLENRLPSPPRTLKEISIWPREWWESVEWDDPNAKDVLSPFVSYKSF